MTLKDSFCSTTKSTGKIFKGTLNDAPTKLRVASIPSKFQNIIYRNNKDPAFGNSRQRFYSETQSQKMYYPGPGEYINSSNAQNKIYSKKGYGSMISNTKLQRVKPGQANLPGPASYNPNLKIMSRMKKSASLALLANKLQGHQLFKSEIQRAKKIPGPGIYKPDISNPNSQTHLFSQDKHRFSNRNLNSIYINDQQTPGVGYYRYELSTLHFPKNHSNSNHSPTVSYKKNITQINHLNQRTKLKIARQIIMNKTKTGQKDNPNVAPGTYNTTMNIFDKKIGFKIHQSSIDRFGQSVKKRNNDHHQSININQKKQNGLMKQSQNIDLISSTVDYQPSITKNSSRNVNIPKGLTSIFKSNLARYDFIQKNINDPGRYSPSKVDKKSHLINFENKWV